MVGLVSSHATPCCYRVQGSANCRLEGTYVHEQRKPWLPLMLEAGYKPSGWLGIMCAPSTTAWPCASPSLAHVQPPCVQYVIRHSCCCRAGARRLGSRLYFEVTAKALDDSVEWERVADSVAVEVQRHGAPPPSSAAAAAAQAMVESVPQDAAAQVAAVAPAPQSPASVALAARGAPLAGFGAAAGVSVNSVHNKSNAATTTRSNSNVSNSTNNINNNSVSNTNTGNTSIVLL